MTVASFQLRIARLGIQFEPEYSLVKFWHETKVAPGGGPSVSSQTAILGSEGLAVLASPPAIQAQLTDLMLASPGNESIIYLLIHPYSISHPCLKCTNYVMERPKTY